MTLERWRPRLMTQSPFRELVRMEREMEEMFGRLPRWPWSDRERVWAPAVDMIDHADEIVLRADLPGLDEKDIEVTVQDGTLVIRGQREGGNGGEEGGLLLQRAPIWRLRADPGAARGCRCG